MNRHITICLHNKSLTHIDKRGGYGYYALVGRYFTMVYRYSLAEINPIAELIYERWDD